MSKRLKVNVTENDILRGEQESPLYCAVARALKRAGRRQLDKRIEYASVGRAWASLGMPDESGFTVRFPKIVKKFIREFDAGEPVDPITFEAEVK